MFRGITIWCTGLSGSGKSTICSAVCEDLSALGYRVQVLDGDVLRQGICKDLGFSKRDREENARRITCLAAMLNEHGIIVLVAAISPYRDIRDRVRLSGLQFIEVYVNAPLSVCEQRDPKGLYKRVRAGELSDFTGIDAPYEPPVSPDVECRTAEEDILVSSNKVLSAALGLLRNL